MNTLSQKDAFSRARTEELALGGLSVPPFLWISEGGWLCLWLSWGRQPLSLVRRQSRSSASMSFGPPAPPGPPSAPPVFCPGWNLEEEGAASEPQKGLHWGSWTKSFTNRQQRLPLLDGDEGLTKWQMLRLHTVLSLFNQPCPTLGNPVDCSTTGFPVLHHLPELLKLVSTESVMPSNPLILCCPLLLPPSIFPSIRVFSNESALRIMWPKYWSFSFSISPSNEHSGLISFRIDWLDLLAVQRTLKNLVQHHSSKASILRCSAFFMVQLSHPYMTTGKTAALTRQTSDVSAF